MIKTLHQNQSTLFFTKFRKASFCLLVLLSFHTVSKIHAQSVSTSNPDIITENSVSKAGKINSIYSSAVIHSCGNPTVPTLHATSTTNCCSASTTLTIATGSLNSATAWHWYRGSCGGVAIGTGNSITVSPSTTTTYFARGEGGGVTVGACGSITITVLAATTVANAGPDIAICSSPGVATMAGNTAVVGTGAWTQVSGPASGTITTVSSPTTTIAGLTVAGVYVFKWTISHAPCSSTSDLIQVTVSSRPAITCSGNQTANAGTGLCSAIVTYPAPVVSGSPAPSISHTFSGATTGSGSGTGNGSSFNTGITTVTLTATNTCGTSSCSFTVRVIDNQAPIITCPATAHLLTGVGSCTSSASAGHATATDNCSVSSITVNNAGPYALGTTSVIWTATDVNGNTSTCSQTIIVTDGTAPSITAPADVAVCHGSVVTLGTATATDNCGSVSLTNNAPSTFPIGTTVVTYTATDGSGNIATASQNVRIDSTVTGTSSSVFICDGSQTNINLTASIPGSSFTWTAANTSGLVIGYTDCSAGCGTTITDILSNLSGTGGIVQYTVTPSTGGGCAGSPFVVSVTVGAAPSAPVISGPTATCGLATVNYTATSTFATSYIWTTPAGITITSGAGTSSIVCSTAGFTNAGTLTCTAVNACGSSSGTSVQLTKLPAPPTVINGPTSVCAFTTATYAILPCDGATSYNWTVPSGMTITSGAGTTQIAVTFNPSLVLGYLQVNSVNACGTVNGPIILITGHVPATPGTFTGPTNVCGLASAAYSVPAVAYATGYSWTVPSWMTVTSGGGTNTITVSVTGTPAADTISVGATDACGTSIARAAGLTLDAEQPGVITGPTNLCGVSTAAYSIASLSAGYTYNWTLAMTGWTITSGAGTTSITCAGSSAGATTAGIVNVTSSNTCGSTSAISSLATSYCHSAIVINHSGANQNSNVNYGLYPNPTNSEFKLDVTTDSDEEMTLQVYDVLGNLIISEKHNVSTGSSTLTTTLENHKAGLYFVRLLDSTAGSVYSQTVIKQ
jgi:hypothetical protein